MKKITELRNLEKTRTVNNGFRSLFESVIANEVLETLKDWIENDNSNCVLIGGVALSYYVKPRTTTDVDLLFLVSEDIPKDVYKFRRHRNGAFEHIKTQVEVEVVIPKSINLPEYVAKIVFETANKNDGLLIASPSGIVALKLHRFLLQDQADIDSLIKCCDINLTPFKLDEKLLKRYEQVKNYKIDED